jgi:hypothetical protein
MDTQWDLDISRFVPLEFELMAIGTKANKVFNTLYIKQKAWYNRTYKSTIVNASNKCCTKQNRCKNGCQIPISKIT